MVRTRADLATTRVVGAKAPRKNFGESSNGNSDKTKGPQQSGGNSYFPRETPEWQKPITSFFNRPKESGESSKRDDQMEIVDDDLSAGASTSGGSSASRDDTTD